MTETPDLPELVTSRLRISALRPADAAELRDLTDDPVILGAVHFLPDPFGLADAEALLAGATDHRSTFFGGRLLAEGALATICGAHLRGADEIEIGYWVGSAYRGRGLAFEAAGAVVAALRVRHPHRRLVAECRPDNQASWRLLAKLGFRSSGLAGERPGRTRLVA